MSLLPFLEPIMNTGFHVSTSIQNENQRQRQNRFNAEQAQLNRDFQAQQAEIARDWQEQQYNKYSSPEAMVRQYQEAGLNPALMQNSSLQSSTGSSSSPSGSAASGSALGSPLQSVSGIVRDLIGLKKLDAEVDNIYADSEQKRAAAAVSGSTIELNKQSISKMKQEVKNLIAEEKNENTKNGLIIAQTLLAEQDKKMKQGQTVSISYDNLKKEFEQRFQEKYGFYPDSSIVKTSLGFLHQTVTEIEHFGKRAINFVKELF